MVRLVEPLARDVVGIVTVDDLLSDGVVSDKITWTYSAKSFRSIQVKLAAAHPAVELRGMLRAAALVVLVFRTVPKHVAL